MSAACKKPYVEIIIRLIEACSFEVFMRWLFLLAAFLPGTAFAEARIAVRIEFSDQRVRPNPGPVHSHLEMAFLLKDDGTVAQEYHETGPKGRHLSSDNKLGDGMKVIDANTLVRKIDFKDRVNTLTITVSGKTCHATMTNILKSGFTEFESWSSYQGVTAWYRDWQMTSSTCTIR
jgi:hypothetical protein